MKCPCCDHVSETALLQCSSCGEAFDRSELETLEHLEYLLEWLEKKSTEIDQAAYETLHEDANIQVDDLRQAMQIEVEVSPLDAEIAPEVEVIEAIPPAPPITELEKEELSQELLLTHGLIECFSEWATNAGVSEFSSAVLEVELNTRCLDLRSTIGKEPVSFPAPSTLNILDFGLQQTEKWDQEGIISGLEIERLRNYFAELRAEILGIPILVPDEEVVPTLEPVIEPKPIIAKPPPKPKEVKPREPLLPAIDWGKVWERTWHLVVSGALLQGLLYLGAFMIIVAAVVMVVAYWSVFPVFLQLIFIAALPASFYLAGILLRSKLGIPVAGSVFIGIGMVLVAVDFAAIYQFGGLSEYIDISVYWLGASVFCTALYTLTAWRLPTPFTTYITLIALTCSVIAFATVFNLPLEWRITLLTALMAGVVASGHRLQEKREASGILGTATRRFPQVVVPISLALVLFVPGSLRFGSGVSPALGQAATFMFASVTYGFLAWQNPRRVYIYASVVCTIPMFGFLLFATPLPLMWYPTVAALLTPLYLGGGYWFTERLPPQLTGDKGFPTAVYGAGYGLLVVAVVAGITLAGLWLSGLESTFWAGIVALVLGSGDLAFSTVLFRRPILVLPAAGLFIVPYSLVINNLLKNASIPHAGVWMMTAWAILGVVYIGVGAIYRKEAEYSRWLYAWALILSIIAVLGLGLYSLVSDPRGIPGPLLTAMSAILVLYIVSAILHDSRKHPGLSNWFTDLPAVVEPSIFLWIIGLLLPLWLGLVWSFFGLDRSFFGPSLVIMGLGYVGIGRRLGKRNPTYHLPYYAYAYGLATIGVLASLGNTWPLITSLYLSVAILISMTYIYRRTIDITLALLLFLWPFFLTLQTAQLPLFGYLLAFTMLAAGVYLPIGIWLERISDTDHKTRLEDPPFIFAYLISTLMLVVVIAGNFILTAPDLAWITVIVPIIVCGTYLYGLRHFNLGAFAWASVLTIALTYYEILVFLKIPTEYVSLAWILLAYCFLLFNNGLLRIARDDQPWFLSLDLPLRVGTIAIGALAFTLSIGTVFNAMVGVAIDAPPTLITQLLCALLMIFFGWIHRTTWPLYVEPWLLTIFASSFFIVYGEEVFGSPVSIGDYAILFSLLGLTHLIAAASLDSHPIRYARGLYLGAYGLISVGVLWSLAMQSNLVWTIGIGIVVAIISAVLVYSGQHRSWSEFGGSLRRALPRTIEPLIRQPFTYVVAWILPLWIVLLLGKINLPSSFRLLGISAGALLLLGISESLRRQDRQYATPFFNAAQAYTLLGLILSIQPTVLSFSAGEVLDNNLVQISITIVSQSIAILFYFASAVISRHIRYAWLAAWLLFIPYTLTWIAYGDLVGAEYSIPWIALAATLLVVGYVLDPNKIRFANGPYAAGYALVLFTIGWSLAMRSHLVWTLGMGITTAFFSAILVHTGRHYSWDDFVHKVQRAVPSRLESVLRQPFTWVVAWLLPIWIVVFLGEFSIPDSYRFLGYTGGALLLLGIGVRLKRLNPSYATPFYSAAQAYTVFGLILSVRLTAQTISAGYVFVQDTSILTLTIASQSVAVLFYSASAVIFKRKLFTWLAAWLCFIPYTLAWITYGNLEGAEYAIAWVALTTVLLIIAFVLDPDEIRYAHGPYAAGYVLAVFALSWSTSEPLITLYTLATTLVIALLSQVAVYKHRQHSYLDLLGLLRFSENTLRARIARTFFLFIVAYGTPVWLFLLLNFNEISSPWIGLSLALLAPLYIAIGLRLRSVDKDYTWPLYSAGYALTAIGAMISFSDIHMAIYVLLLNTLVYAASAYIFRQAFWLYLATFLGPAVILLTIHYNFGSLPNPWVSSIFLLVAFLYIGTGQLFDRLLHARAVSSYALPFYVPAFLLSAIAITVATFDRGLAIVVFSVGSAFYVLSSWLFKEALLLYPASWLLPVPYYLLMTLTPMDPRLYGVGWLPMIIVYLAIGRFGFKSRTFAITSLKSALKALNEPSMPFYLAAYALSVSMLVLSQPDPIVFSLAWVLAAVIYFTSAALFRSRLWLYPGLMATHLAVLTFFSREPSTGTVAQLAFPFLVITWLVGLAGYGFSRRSTAFNKAASIVHSLKVRRWEVELERWPSLAALTAPSWAQPFFHILLIDILLWQAIALGNGNSASLFALGITILLGLLASLWRDPVLPYLTFAYFFVAIGFILSEALLTFAEAMAAVSGIGFTLYLIAQAIRASNRIAPRIYNWLSTWARPLTNISMVVTTLAVIANLPAIFSQSLAAAVALAFGGALYLTIAYQGHHYRLGYMGLAMLLISWIVLLIGEEVEQPQLYAIPAGLYFIAVGYLEHSRKEGRYPILLEAFGYCVLLVTAFMQSIDPVHGFLYFTLMLAEGLILIWWGAARRMKVPFFIGFGASVLAVIAQLVVLLNTLEGQLGRWILILGVGFTLIVVAVFVERNRERIIVQALEWRDDLETWT